MSPQRSHCGYAHIARRRFLAFAGAIGAAAVLPSSTYATPEPGLPDAETATALALTDLDAAGLEKLKVGRTRICDLACPTGRIIACDPLVMLPSAKHFAISVPSGVHPVSVYPDLGGNAWGDRVGLLELRVSDAPVTRWRIALVDEAMLPKMIDDMISGYGVDAGMGCFIDEAAARALDAHEKERSERREDSYSEIVLLDAALKMERSGEHRFAFDQSLNVAMCQSGYGDGHYASYWGFGADGAPARLVTSFGVFESRERDAKDNPKN